jgi:hypothetical protein
MPRCECNHEFFASSLILSGAQVLTIVAELARPAVAPYQSADMPRKFAKKF